MTKQKQAEKDLQARSTSPNPRGRANREMDMNAISEERTDPSLRLS